MITVIIITALATFIPTAWFYERQLDLLTRPDPQTTTTGELHK